MLKTALALILLAIPNFTYSMFSTPSPLATQTTKAAKALIGLRFMHSNSQQVPIHYLRPPLLKPHNWGEKILCHRPMRHGAPRMDIEEVGNKLIVNNYGHGGSGWTVAPGCVNHVIDTFEKRLTKYQRSSAIPINVIGAGALGLFTAHRLANKGYSNIKITADKFTHLTSHNAGGFLAPSTMAVDPAKQKTFDTICFDAYCFYQNIAKGKNPLFPATGALIMPIYLKRHDNRLQAYEDVVMQKPKDVIIDFGNDKTYEMKVYNDGIFMDTGVLMKSLITQLYYKAKWDHKKVTSIAELQEPYIFNCAGLGAKEINKDEAMVSVQGHLIMLEDQKPTDMNYMISFYVDEGKTESGQPIKRSIYLFPKHVPGTPEKNIGVMGGTFIEGATPDTPNEEEFELIMQRAREFFGS